MPCSDLEEQPDREVCWGVGSNLLLRHPYPENAKQRLQLWVNEPRKKRNVRLSTRMIISAASGWCDS